MSPRHKATDKAWVDRWGQCGPVLKEIQRRELRQFKHSENVHIISSLLQLGHGLSVPRLTTGLVEQQRLFQRARS